MPNRSAPGAGARASGALQGLIAPRLRTVMFGHSYIDQEFLKSSLGRSQASQRGTFNWANTLLGKPMRLVGERGVGGERIRDWLARFDADVLPLRPGLVIITDPINDLKNTVNAGYQTDPRQVELPYVIEGYTKLVDRITRDLGALCVILGASPPNPAETNLLGARCVLWNRWAMGMAAANREVLFSPVHLALINPTSAAGLVTNASTGSAAGYYDAIHPNILGAYARGKILANTLAGGMPEWDRLVYTMGETIANQTVTVTSFDANGATATVLLSNGALSELRTGDLATFWNDGNLALNGTYRVLAHSSTSLTLACAKTGTASGTMKISGCTQALGNPLFTTTTGGTTGGTGAARISGNVPTRMSVTNDNASASCSVTLSTAAHTDKSGVADGFGNWLIADIVADAAMNVQFNIWAHRGAITASPVFGMLGDGDVISAMIEAEVVGASGGSGNPSGLKSVDWSFLALCTPPGSSQQGLSVYDMYRDPAFTDAYPQVPWRGVMETHEWRIPAGYSVDSVDCNLNVAFSGAGSARVRIARASLHKWAAEMHMRGLTVDTDFAKQ